MKIRQILSQHRRDFTAYFSCEHCDYTFKALGYDDANFHNNVIPNMECPDCGKKSGEDYQPLEPKYPEGFQV